MMIIEGCIISVDDCGQLDAVFVNYKQRSCQVDGVRNIQLSSSSVCVCVCVSSDLTRYFVLQIKFISLIIIILK